MATIRAVLESRLNRYNIELGEVSIDETLVNANLTGTDQYQSFHDAIIKRALVLIIPELLLIPDVTEGGYAKKFDRSAIITFYGMMCSELGMENKLEVKQPQIRDRSNLW